MSTPPLSGFAPPAGIVWQPSPNFWSWRGGHAPIAIVHHIMEGTLAGTDAAFATSASQVSAHYGLGADGTIHQYVHLFDSAWANGGVRNPNLAAVPWIGPLCQDGGVNPNHLTISIEWEGFHRGAVWGRVPWAGGSVATMLHEPAPTFWTPSGLQYAAGLALTRWLAATWRIPADRAHQLRHADFDSVTRWFCPGPGFDLKQLISDLGGHV